MRRSLEQSWRSSRLKLAAEKRKIYLPNKVLRGDDTGGHGVSKSVQLNGFVCLEVLLAEEDVEVRVLFD